MIATPNNPVAITPQHILLVDNESDWTDLISECLKGEYYVETANSKATAVDCIQSKPFDVVITNLHLITPKGGLSAYPQSDYLGAQVIEAVHNYAPGTPCIVVSGNPHLVKQHLGIYPEWSEIIYKQGLRLNDLVETVQRVVAERHNIESTLAESGSRAGQSLRQITQNPIVGIETLIQIILADVPKLGHRIPDLGVRLAKLHELDQQLQQVGMLTGTQEAEKRIAIHFAIGVCFELENLDKTTWGALS